MTDARSIQQRAADTILQQGVKVQCLTAPPLLRIFGIRRLGITLRQPSLGGLVMISRLLAECGFAEQSTDFSLADAVRLIRDHTGKAVQILAIAVLRHRLPILLLRRPLAAIFKWLMLPADFTAALYVFMAISGVTDFTNTIRLFATTNILSHKTQGSQQVR